MSRIDKKLKGVYSKLDSLSNNFFLLKTSWSAAWSFSYSSTLQKPVMKKILSEYNIKKSSLKSFHSIAVLLAKGGTKKLFTIFAEKISRGGFSGEKCKGWLLFEDQFISSVVVVGGATRYWHKKTLCLWGDINLTLPRKRAKPLAPTSVPRCKFHRSIADNQQREREREGKNNKEFSKFFNSCEFLFSSGTFW